MINWQRLTKYNWKKIIQECDNFLYSGFDGVYHSSEKYVFLTSGMEIVNEARIMNEAHTYEYFARNRYSGFSDRTITHFALKSEYQDILPKELLND